MYYAEEVLDSGEKFDVVCALEVKTHFAISIIWV